ncbi:MBOAT family O-acyltransferase [Hahella sp. HN01]|uniref:MBOAT family O-acyltransferase n=1 Tax=unclassified Hahella TaxID=2624107 RepID=UPI001C1F1562|nr:MBOAT family O-acyltransferase [Hahella sp. HN01]MBU6954781.1 MBOAT family protein [Hahella sp. HN01]
MPFNTYLFFIFFAAVWIIYSSCNNWRLQKLILLAASYLFYSAWNPSFVFLLLFSTVCDWYVAKGIFRAESKKKKQVYVWATLLINLGLLGFFKYWNFLSENLSFLSGGLIQASSFDILLPMGISFYTFQTISYSIDVYRGKIKPATSFSDYALYVSFFPQLVAGPIVRANDFLPQCEEPKKASADQLGWGLCLVIFGVFQKVVLADSLFAPIVDTIYQRPEIYGQLETWVAVFAFSGQIFCDFSGYSTTAIGVALCFGFILPDNFKSPYGAVGVQDFWRRWHISLSTWLRDYVYVSMGGNRVGAARTYVNLMFTMLIGGLWHGASWMFVIWGGLHGLYLTIARFIQRSSSSDGSERTTGQKLLLAFFTFILVSVTWIFFRSQSMEECIQVIRNLFGNADATGKVDGLKMMYAFVGALVLFFTHFALRERSIEALFTKLNPFMRAAFLSVCLVSLFLFASGDTRAFIYFQF